MKKRDRTTGTLPGIGDLNVSNHADGFDQKFALTS
jgi:hypothetical protein